MAECIVCKGEYTPGRRCTRCGSDNILWERWQRERLEEQEGARGMLAFAAPHLYLPLLLMVLSFSCGLIGLSGCWRGVQPGIQLLAVVVAVFGCSLVFQDVHAHRHAIRLQRLLNRVRKGWKAVLTDAELWAIILPALALLFSFLLAIALTSSDLLWSLARWLLFEPGYGMQEGGGVQERILAALPLMLLLSYVGFTISFAYASSLLLAMRYAQEMDRHLPQPIFLRGDLLANVVRQEVERQLARPGGFTVRTTRGRERWLNEARREGPELPDGQSPDAFRLPQVHDPSGGLIPPMIPPGLQGISRWKETVEHFGRWNWEEMERTLDGGIKMKARGEYQIKMGETEAGLPTIRSITVIYTVKADPWGRVQKISRGREEGEPAAT